MLFPWPSFPGSQIQHAWRSMHGKHLMDLSFLISPAYNERGLRFCLCAGKNVPWSIFTATVIVEFAIFLDVLLTNWPLFTLEGAFMVPLQTLPKAPWPSSSFIVISLLFNSHLSLVSSFVCSLCSLLPLQHQLSWHYIYVCFVFKIHKRTKLEWDIFHVVDRRLFADLKFVVFYSIDESVNRIERELDASAKRDNTRWGWKGGDREPSLWTFLLFVGSLPWSPCHYPCVLRDRLFFRVRCKTQRI